MEALEPFRAPAYIRPAGDPAPLTYLSSEANRRSGGIELRLEVLLSSAQMRESGIAPVCISQTNLVDLYWTFGQMIAHHTSNGCNLCSGDLVASGTVSGETQQSKGCLLEMTQRGAAPLCLPTGEVRGFLEDGDEVILRGCCQKDGFARIGFGECRGILVPSLCGEPG